MLRTLFFIPTQIGDVPLFGFSGVLFLLWCVGSLIFLAVQIVKHGWKKEAFSSATFLIVVAAVLSVVLPEVAKPQGIPIRGYGTMLFIAIVSATGLCLWRAVARGYSPDAIISLIFWLFVLGIIGARIFYVVEYWPEFRVKLQQGDYADLLNIADGGIVVYGSLIGGVIALIFFTRKHGLPVLATCDLLAPSMMLGLAIGRIGCLMNGCCFGGPCDLPWAVRFPKDSPPYEEQIVRGQVYGFRISGDPKKPATVLEVTAGSPAAEAGLKKGDLIETLSGFKITACRDVFHVLRWESYPKEEPVDITTAEGKKVSISGGTGGGSQSSHPPDADIQFPERLRDPLHPARGRTVPAPRRRTLLPDADPLRADAFHPRNHPHRRSGCPGNVAEHLPER